ncbi:hypothetical protein A4A49_04947 [Nicotiana attenuata]|uniref:Uncharacterized protein n=1 Tax=Nicotiana attenuata TaxID=49451 RepID=A0A1J6I8U7_NICAT|nr:hypothetical protein A4A49_04947 [Nicotiana attenuata]
MMLRVANSRGLDGGYDGDYSGVTGFGMWPIKEYDEKVLVEIYKSMMAKGIIVPRDVAASASAKIGPEIICSGNKSYSKIRLF